MAVLSPASRVQPTAQDCPNCGRVPAVWVLRSQGPTAPFRTWRNVAYKRAVVAATECPKCKFLITVKTTMRQAGKEPKPVRDEIVQAIKRHKAAGWKYAWES